MALACFNSASFVTTAGLGISVSPTVEVRRESDSALAAIFSDAAGTTPITNPSAFADSVGRFKFYAAGIVGGYSILVTKGAESFTLRNVGIGTAGQRDIENFVDAGAYLNASGDGVTDDTVSIQASLNSGVKYVHGVQGKTYLVSQVGTKTFNGAAHRYCVLIPDGVTLDLSGATVKLAASQNAALFMNATAGTTQNLDVGLCNGVLDGNQANQTAPGAGEMSCVVFHDVLRPKVYNLRAKNVRQYAGRFLAIDKGYFNDLHCEDSDGDGWSFGLHGTAGELRVSRSFIDNIYAENCNGTMSGGLQVGNGAILTVQYCQVGKIITKDCAAGLKLQDSSQDSSFAELMFIGKTNGAVNSGVKIQGSGSLYPKRITVDLVTSQNSYGNGFNINHINSVSVGRYVGNLNGSGAGATGSDKNDFQVDLSDGDGPNSVQIGSIELDTPAAIGFVQTDSDACKFTCESIIVRNPTGVAVQLSGTSAGRINIGHIGHIDDAGTPTTTYVLNVSGAPIGRVGSIETNLTHSTSQSRVSIAGGTYDFEIGSIRLGSANLLDGVKTLTNASATTAVTCGHIWRDYVGGASDFFQPLISVTAWDSTSGTLMGTSAIRATVTDGSSEYRIYAESSNCRGRG